MKLYKFEPKPKIWIQLIFNELYVLISMLWDKSNCSENLFQTEQNDNRQRKILQFNSYATADTLQCANPLEEQKFCIQQYFCARIHHLDYDGPSHLQ